MILLPRLTQRMRVLTAGTLAVFGALGLARFGYTVVLPAMQAGLALDNTEAGMLATVNLAGYLVLSAFAPAFLLAAGVAVAGAIGAAFLHPSPSSIHP